MIEPDYPFRSDGCTFSPDGVWRQCCVAHDRAYWMGGTYAQRLKADRRFRDCLRKQCLQHDWNSFGGWLVSRAYYYGVRVGGVGWIPLRRARWGFGWRYPRTGP